MGDSRLYAIDKANHYLPHLLNMSVANVKNIDIAGATKLSHCNVLILSEVVS